MTRFHNNLFTLKYKKIMKLLPEPRLEGKHKVIHEGVKLSNSKLFILIIYCDKI